MALMEDIQAALKKAMLARNTIARDTLRMLKSELGAEAARQGRELTDPEQVQILKRAVKSRRDSITSYLEGGRPDAAEQEESEIKVIEEFLPQQLDATQTRAALEALATELGLESKREMGRLMKELMARHPGQVDGKLASGLAAQILS
jgi:hypothetical protein